MAILTRCLRSDEHVDVRLFVPRDEYQMVREFLISFLNSKRSRGRRLLVHGERGSGKSIGVRAAIDELGKERTDFFPIIVPGDRCHNITHLITLIADVLAEQVRQYFPKDKDLLQQTSHLIDMVRLEKITRGQFIKLGTEIEGKVEQDFGLLEFFKLRLGIRGAIKEERGTEEKSEMLIDDTFRLQLLGRVLTGIASAKEREPLLFVDNLDQITEKERLSGLLKSLLSFEEIPVVITVRTEFVPHDILREHRMPVVFKGLSSEQLVNIVMKRLEIDCPDAGELRARGMLQITQGLAEATGNPLAFLRWLEYLCWYTELNIERYRNDLKGYVPAYHGLIVDEVERVASWYFERGKGWAKRAALRESVGLEEDDIDMLEEAGVLVPDDITRPSGTRRYCLSPLLMFLKPPA